MQVNYVGKGSNLYESGYEYHGSSLVGASRWVTLARVVRSPNMARKVSIVLDFERIALDKRFDKSPH